jgi:hypothetical protein
MDNNIVKYYNPFKNTYSNILISTIIGNFSYTILSFFMLVDMQGVNYYGEAHLTRWNAYMHTLGMPFTIYGMLLWIPALFRLNESQAHQLQYALYFIYGGHYMVVDRFIGLLYYLFYYQVVKMGQQQYKIKYITNKKNYENKTNHNQLSILRNNLNKSIYLPIFIEGFLISFLALTFQEVAGHYYGGDIPSRFEAIPNAILYAMFFSVSHIFI